MATIKLIKAFLKKQKVYAISIFILTLIISASFISICSVLIDGSQHFDTINENSNSPDFINWVTPQDYDEDKINTIESNEYVDSVEKTQSISFYSDKVTVSIFINGEKTGHSIPFRLYEPNKHSYVLETKDSSYTPSQGNVFLPYIYKELYDCEVGDYITIEYRDVELKYEVEEFYEHSFSSSSMLGFKEILVNEDDFEDMKKLDDDVVILNTSLYTYLKDDTGEDTTTILRNLNKESDIENYGDFAYSLEFFKQGSLILLQIISVILLIFIAILFGIVLLVINYAIKSSIERDYSTFGVLKALGFTGNQVLKIVVTHYVLISCVGILCGVACSFGLVNFVGNILMSGTGFIYQTHINLAVLIFGAIGIVIFIVLLSILAARKVKKISPVQAIGKGKAPVYFSSRLNVSIDKLSFLPFTLRLSLKQIITNLRQYVAIILMSVFLIFSMITMMNVKQEFTEKNVLKLVGVQDADIWIRYKEYDDKMNDEILSFIEKEDGIENEFMEGNTYLTIENLRVFSASMNNYDTSTIQPVKGRWPKYKNEVSITKVVADSIDKELGDTVMMRYKDGEEKEYIICGYHQTMNELGKYIFLSEEGIQQLDESYEENSVSIDLKGESKTNELVDKLKDTFNDDNIDVVNLQENMGFQSEVVVGAVQSVANGVNIFAIGLVAIVVLLISSICMEREKMDLGVMRAQGFTVRQLRIMFTLRFTTVVLISGVVSLFISLLVSDWLLSQALSIAGVSHFSSEIGFENTFLPILLITGFIFIFSYVVTRKIKKVNVVKLIKE